MTTNCRGNVYSRAIAAMDGVSVAMLKMLLVEDQHSRSGFKAATEIGAVDLRFGMRGRIPWSLCFLSLNRLQLRYYSQKSRHLKKRTSGTMKIAVEGCCHGELDAIYASLQRLEREKGQKVDLLLIGGDFQVSTFS